MSLTSSVGLISGIDHASIIDQLMALEARSQTLVKNQTAVLQSQQVAYQAVNAKLLVLKMSAATLAKETSFTKTAVSSSNEMVATATAADSAPNGSHSFTVGRLVTTQQAISAGLSSMDEALGTASTLSFEFGNARLDTDTNLAQLNGAAGITRGKIRLTDRSGASAVVDLSKAVTVNDVLDAINNTSGINITASISGDSFTLADNTGLALADLAVADVNTPGVAVSLGLLGSTASATMQGAAVNRLGENTQLSALNDGNGVRSRFGQADFNITSSGGVSFDVDLGSAKTVGDVLTLINDHAGNTGQAITASIDGTGIVLTDNTGSGAAFAVTALNDSLAAADLGILGNDADGSSAVGGKRLLASLNSRLVGNLLGGDGSLELGVIDINGTQVDLATAGSVSDILDTINAAGTGVTAALNSAGNGISLVAAPNTTIAVSDVSGNAASAMGLAQTTDTGRLESANLQLRYISEATQLATLNGGKGVAKGNFIITDSDGNTATVDMSAGSEKTIQDVIDDINSRGLAINARINDTGDGITLEDTGSGAVAIRVEESGSTTARDLGILGTAQNPGESLFGTFEKKVEILETDTLTDIAKKINDAGVGVAASVFSDGSPNAPYRLSLISKQQGRAGAFVFDDGGLGLNMSNLVDAQDAVVFYGSADPAKAIAITSSTNTLASLIPGVTINLHSASSSPVTINISQNDSAVTDAVKKFVDDFNAVTKAIKQYTSYNAETEEKGILLGDSTMANITSSLYSQINARHGEAPGIFKSLAQVGMKLANGATLELDAEKFTQALATDRQAVIDLFAFKETTTDEETGELSVTKRSFGVKFEDLMNRITDSVSGSMQNAIDGLDSRIVQNTRRVEDMQVLLDAKRGRLEAQFAQMESVLAQMQNQTSALNSLAQLAASYSAAAKG